LRHGEDVVASAVALAEVGEDGDALRGESRTMPGRSMP
jgi:hypothetical protein